jgi:hypothetical protein
MLIPILVKRFIINEGKANSTDILNNTDYFSMDGEGLHMSYGAGLRIVMNENFIIAVDYGMAANEQDGTSGLYIGWNYMF